MTDPYTHPFGRDREDALDHAADTSVDVLVVGGGITGVGVALDAVTRGYRVALVERDDLASGTSSKSSKLVHGGVRYLANGDLPMVAEGVRERDRLRRLAPHLVRPLGFLVPVDDAWTSFQMKAGMVIYDGVAVGRSVRRHQHVDIAALLQIAPGMARGFRRGAYRYYDSQTDDARLVLAVAQEARRYGADIVTHAEVVELLESSGRVVGATVRDGLSGTTVDLSARWVVSATGVWAQRLRSLSTTAPGEEITPAKGVHLALSRRDIDVAQAVVVPSGIDDGRMAFVIPWGDQVYVGTTDDLYSGDLDRPDLAPVDADYLLHAVNLAFGTDLHVVDCIGAWAGLRPLIGSGTATKDLSRRHAIFEDPPGLVTITGGKLTTFRQMAEDVVDVLAEVDGLRTPCRTTRLPLGARGLAEDGVARTRNLFETLAVDPAHAGSLYHRHGDDAPTVLRACLDGDGAEPLLAGLPYLRGEVAWAVRQEFARTLGDVLQRRMRVALRDARAGGAAVAEAAAIMQRELGWDDTERERQIDEYLDAVARERGVVPLDTSWREALAPR